MNTYPVFNLGQRSRWGAETAWSPANRGLIPQGGQQCPPGQFWDGRTCRGSIAGGGIPGGGSQPTAGGAMAPGISPQSGMFGSCPHCARGRGGSVLGQKQPPAPGVCCQLDQAGNTVCSDGKIYPPG